MLSAKARRTEIGQLRHAFELLAQVELGGAPEWQGPDDAEDLQSRVELLALWLNIVPRSKLNRLDEVLADWMGRFPAHGSVSGRALRESAHAILREASPEGGQDEAASDMRRVEAFLGVQVDRGKHGPSPDARQQCATGLFVWQSQLRLGADWTTLPGAVPGDPRMPIEDVYVDLFAAPRDDELIGQHMELLMRGPRARSARLGGEAACISVSAMVARTLDLCVVVGEPGSGKSTLVQWLAWATSCGKLPDFEFAIVVRLRYYAASLAERPGLTPVELFLESLVPRFEDWKEAADCLREAASRTRRVLLLLDGWDEVPVEMRDRTREQIQKEYRHFVVVITSRASGLPWQLVTHGQADYYEIAGLAPAAVRSFVAKQLPGEQRKSLAERVIAQIEKGPDLRAMAANPFILGLLVKVLSQPAGREKQPILADVYRRIVNWVAEQYWNSRAAGEKLTGAHFRALEALAYRLVFEEQSPRYTFDRHELDGLLGDIGSDALLDSRFVDRLDPEADSWSFLHATLEEYLAACRLGELSDDEQVRRWDRSVCSQSRLVALEFFAGLVNTRAVCEARGTYWLKNADRYGMILLRLARLAKAGGWSRHSPELVNSLHDRLWVRIKSVDDWRLARLFVEGLAELDAAELVRRAATETGVDGRVWEAVIDLVPLDLVKEGGLFAKLPKNMRDHLTIKARERPSEACIDRVAGQLADERLPESELPKLLEEASLMADAKIDLALLERLRGVQDEEFSASLIMALAPQFGVLPIDTVLNLLTETSALPPTVRQLASASLSHRKGRGARLDPESRDRLLRRLAVLRPNDERVGPILDSLTGFPVRDGGRLIAEIATDRNVPSNVRISAIDVLETTSELAAVELAVTAAVKEPEGTVADVLVELAVKRNAGLPLDWLEARIAGTEKGLSRRTLVTAYLRVLTANPVRPDAPMRPFLKESLRQAFAGTGFEDDEQAWLWATALRGAELGFSRLADTQITELAHSALHGFVSGEDVALGAVRLATALLRGDAGEGSVWRLRRALDAILRFLKSTREKRESREFELAAIEIADNLADTSLDLLLKYPAECGPVRDVLASRARDSGWLVFEDRVLDADGNAVASLEEAKRSGVDLTPEAIRDLLTGLNDSQRNAILSFWLMTRVYRLCDDKAGYQEINERIREVIRGREGGQSAIENLRELYGLRPPNLDAWRRALAHAARELKLTPDGAQFLYELGLPRR